MSRPQLSVRGLVKSFRTRAGVLRAVDGVSFDIKRGETLALVGESGCGKSTVAKLTLGLLSADAGSVALDPGDRAEGHANRARIGIVFQNPYSSLNPRMRVRDLVAEPLRLWDAPERRAVYDVVEQRLADVGLGPEHMKRFPHEFSGGQRQRIAIARALALRPDVLLLDEPTAALDVSVQAQILNLLRDLQDKGGLSYLLISHDLATVESVAHRVMVMYCGRVVEEGPVEQIFRAPAHPYTAALLDAVPSLDPHLRDRLRPLDGETPSMLNPPAGCAFSPRCERVRDDCRSAKPDLVTVRPGQTAACFHPIAARYIDDRADVPCSGGEPRE